MSVVIIQRANHTDLTPTSGAYAMTTGPDGNIWFTQRDSNQIGKLNPKTGDVTELGSVNGLTGNGLEGIAAGPDGNLWFTEFASDMIGKIDLHNINPTTGLPSITEFALGGSGPHGPQSITPGPDGNLWFTEFLGNQIGMINPMTGAVTEFGGLSGSNPQGITVGPDSNIWFVERVDDVSGTGHIGWINPTTINPTTPTITGEVKIPTSNSAPWGITAGPGNTLWFTEFIGNIGKIDLNTIDPATSLPTVTEFGGLTGGGPAGITLGPDNNLWFVEHDGNQIGTINPTTGIVTDTPYQIPGAGSYSITVGPDKNLWFTEYDANQIGEVTLRAGSTTALVTSVVGPAVFGQAVTLTATVASGIAGSGTPTGTVTFYDGTTVLGSAALGGGTAALTTASLSVGAHTITASYVGDDNFLASTGSLDQVVNKDSTTTAAVSSANPSSFGQPLSLTATIHANSPGSRTPTGSVDFFDTTTGNDVGSVGLSAAGSAVVAVANLAVGSNTITISYFGDGNFVSSTGTVTVTINPSIIVLNPMVSGALSISGNASINVPGIVEVNSRSTTALLASGNAQITASAIDVLGGFKQKDHATFNVTPTTGVATGDPLANLLAPSTTDLTNYGLVKLDGHDTRTLNPGIYSQIKVAGNASLMLNPGIYYLAGGGLTVSGNASITMGTGPADPITGSGVLIYNAGSLGGHDVDYGGITLKGKGTVNLSAALTGPYAGVLIFQARANTRALDLDGHASAGISGVIYAPAALLDLDGHSALQNPLVVRTLNLSGDVSLSQMAAGSDGAGDVAGIADTLIAGDLNVYVSDPGGYFTPSELARIQDTVSGLDTLLAPYNVTITLVSDPSLANLILDNSTTSAVGSAADGVLGCFNGANAEITLLQGWNWYDGADPTQIGANQYDFQTTITHELGHALGLGGASDPSSPMFETLAMGACHRVMTVPDLNIPYPPEGADPLRAAAAGLSFHAPVAVPGSLTQVRLSIPDMASVNRLFEPIQVRAAVTAFFLPPGHPESLPAETATAAGRTFLFSGATIEGASDGLDLSSVPTPIPGVPDLRNEGTIGDEQEPSPNSVPAPLSPPAAELLGGDALELWTSAAVPPAIRDAFFARAADRQFGEDVSDDPLPAAIASADNGADPDLAAALAIVLSGSWGLWQKGSTRQRERRPRLS